MLGTLFKGEDAPNSVRISVSLTLQARPQDMRPGSADMPVLLRWSSRSAWPGPRCTRWSALGAAHGR